MGNHSKCGKCGEIDEFCVCSTPLAAPAPAAAADELSQRELRELHRILTILGVGAAETLDSTTSMACFWSLIHQLVLMLEKAAFPTDEAKDAARDAILESAVQAVADRAGDSDRILLVSAFDAIRAMKKNRHALPESLAIRAAMSATQATSKEEGK